MEDIPFFLAQIRRTHSLLHRSDHQHILTEAGNNRILSNPFPLPISLTLESITA